MITLPAGFDVGLLISDFFALAAPFIGISLLIGFGFLIIKIMPK